VIGRYYARLAWAALLAVVCLPLASCKPDPAWGAPSLAVTVTPATLGTFWVKLAWRYGSDDGNGAVDSVVTSAGVTGGASLEHRHLAAVVRDSFSLASSPGVALAGFACVKAKRRALESSQTCKAWAYTEDDVPPPPPILDTTTAVVGLETLPAVTSLYTLASQEFCTLLVFSTGQKALIGGQRLTSCEQYEANLPPAEMASTAQYEVAATWLSCAIEGDGIRRCVDVDGVVTVAPLGVSGAARRFAA